MHPAICYRCTYCWVYNGGNNNGNGNSYAYIEITGNSTEMLRINPSRQSENDADIDDGNTGTGNLQMAGCVFATTSSNSPLIGQLLILLQISDIIE